VSSSDFEFLSAATTHVDVAKLASYVLYTGGNAYLAEFAAEYRSNSTPSGRTVWMAAVRA